MNTDYGATIIESPYAWLRLTISLLLSTIACIGMWSAVVASPAVQADFGIDRASAIFDLTGLYRATFINAVIWNLFNLIILLILLWLLSRRRHTRVFGAEAPNGVAN